MVELPFSYDVEVVHLLASPLHRYEGRPSDGPQEARGRELHESIEVRAGLGIVGDRYFGHAAHRQASVTVMAAESLDHVQHALGLEKPINSAGTRRNILLRGVDVDALRDATFSIETAGSTVLFRGWWPANPCAWMDETFGEGARRALRGRGGMRCEPLTDGTIHLGPAVLRSSADLARTEISRPTPLFG